VTEGTEAAPIALFEHTRSVYREMLDQSTMVTAEGRGMMVYEGKLTDLITVDVGLAVPYYTRVTQALKGMGCAQQLRRGGGTSGSQWQLITEPTLDLFKEYMAKVEPEDVNVYATIQQVNDLSKRLGLIERALKL
jgi:hypothetical protein